MATVSKYSSVTRSASLLLLLSSLLTTTLPISQADALSHCPRGAISIAPGDSIQAHIDAAPPGATFCLVSGVYRALPSRPKPRQRFYGEDRPILNGSVLVSDFKREAPYWVARAEATSRRQGECMKTSPTCNFPQTLFVDDQPLTRVMQKDQLAPGRFFFDQPEARIYLAEDPIGRTVELTTSAFAFGGGASNVFIDGILFEKFASPAQRGAIDAQNGVGWTIEDSEIRLNASAGLSVGRGTVVRNSNIHHNGQIGITGAGNDIRIENNRIYANNTRGFSMGWEAGGAKISLADRVLFGGNIVQDNRGPGLWCDGDCRNVLYENNTIERNHEAGIYHEISFNAIIRNNVLRHNGMGSDGWFWGDDIIISASEGVEVYDNQLTVTPGRCAIMLIDQGRRDNGRLYKTRNNYIHDNDILFEGSPCAGGVSDLKPTDETFSVISDGNNRFDRNTYRVPRASSAYRFVWGHDEDLDWNALRRAGLEAGGRLVLYGSR
jgi:parallel beta-helix repeat protein